MSCSRCKGYVDWKCPEPYCVNCGHRPQGYRPEFITPGAINSEAIVKKSKLFKLSTDRRED